MDSLQEHLKSKAGIDRTAPLDEPAPEVLQVHDAAVTTRVSLDTSGAEQEAAVEQEAAAKQEAAAEAEAPLTFLHGFSLACVGSF